MAANFVHSFVTSRAAYCNGLPAAAPVKLMDQLQRVSNTDTRLLLRVPRSDFDIRVKVSDRLHWLLMPNRVTFKLRTMVYKCLHGMTNGYPNGQCIPMCTDAHRSHLRSAEKTGLKVSRHKFSTYGSRAVGLAESTEWNYLPAIFGIRSQL